MIDGITVMMLTQGIKELRKQIARGDRHSSVGVPDNLARLAVEARTLATEINGAIAGPVERYTNASKGGE